MKWNQSFLKKCNENNYLFLTYSVCHTKKNILKCSQKLAFTHKIEYVSLNNILENIVFYFLIEYHQRTIIYFRLKSAEYIKILLHGINLSIKFLTCISFTFDIMKHLFKLINSRSEEIKDTYIYLDLINEYSIKILHCFIM